MRATPIAAAVLALGALVGGFTGSSDATAPETVHVSAVASAPLAAGTVQSEDNHGNG
ncbi:hypothetical protein ABZZ80_19100 [Streptomyces sp. NPDC006356]